MKNGNYTITNPKTGSVMIIQITDAADASVVQKSASGEHTAQQARTRADAEKAIERAQVAGMPVEIRTCKKCCFHGPFIDDGETCPQCKLVQ